MWHHILPESHIKSFQAKTQQWTQTTLFTTETRYGCLGIIPGIEKQNWAMTMTIGDKTNDYRYTCPLVREGAPLLLTPWKSGLTQIKNVVMSHMGHDAMMNLLADHQLQSDLHMERQKDSHLN